MTNLSKFQRSRAIGEMKEGKMKVQITREMVLTKFCITKITQKANSLGLGEVDHLQPWGYYEDCSGYKVGAFLDFCQDEQYV